MAVKTMTRRDSIYRIVAKSDDFPSNPVRPWHILVGVLWSIFLVLSIVAPGLMSDISRTELGDWRVFAAVRVGVILFCLFALLVVRGNRTLPTLGMLFACSGLVLRLGVGQAFEEPLTLGLFFQQLAMLSLPLAVMIRPNSTDRLFSLERKHADCEKTEIRLRNDLQKSDNENRRLRNLLVRHGVDYE